MNEKSTIQNVIKNAFKTEKRAVIMKERGIQRV